MTTAPDRLPPGGNPTRKNARIKSDGASWLGIAVAGYILIFFTFGVLGLWAAVAKIDRAVAAPGVVSIETNRKTVEHFEGGMVREILVKEGQAVEKGAAFSGSRTSRRRRVSRRSSTNSTPFSRSRRGSRPSATRRPKSHGREISFSGRTKCP